MKRWREQERQREREKQRTSPGVLASQGHTEERRPCVCVCKGKNSGDGKPT